VTYVLKHEDRWFTIGKHGSPWTVEGAREKAQSLLGQLVRGEDPRPPSAGTFGEAVTLYLSRRKSALRPKTFHEIERYLVTQAKALHPLESFTRSTAGPLQSFWRRSSKAPGQ